jgi:hypothetical protein
MSHGGDRRFECLDPFSYLLEISQPNSDIAVNDALAAREPVAPRFDVTLP